MKNDSVIIIGAGPAGSLTAFLLKQQGWKVTVIEKNPLHGKSKVCGEYLCPAGCELLETLNLGNLLVNYPAIYGMNLYSPDQQKVDTKFPNNKFGRALKREQFDQDLIKLAQESGVEFHFGTHVNSFDLKNDLIHVSDGQKHWYADYLIGADGRQSQVGKWLGLREINSSKRIALHAYLKVRPNVKTSQGEMHIFADGSYCGLNPVSFDKWNFSLVCDASSLKKQTAEALIHQAISHSKRLSQIFDLKENTGECKIVGGITNPMQKLGSIVHKSFLVGDAAGFIDPLTGEGIYHALLTAEKISKSMKIGATTKQMLKNYEMEIKNKYHKKEMVNNFFQWLIRHRKFCNYIAHYLKSRPEARNAFIGLVGNVYSPWEALVIIAKNIFKKEREYNYVDNT